MCILCFLHCLALTIVKLLFIIAPVYNTPLLTSLALSFHHSMSTLTTIKLLVKEIGSFLSSLSNAVPKGSKDNKIWSVMKAVECDTLHETFNQQFDVLFAEDCRNPDGYLHYVCQGKLGMGLIVSYLSKIN